MRCTGLAGRRFANRVIDRIRTRLPARSKAALRDLLLPASAMNYGQHSLKHKKASPNSASVYGYASTDQKHGYMSPVIGTVAAALFLAVNLIYLF